MQEKFIALIPAYEPQVNMIDLLKELLKDRFDIVVVDDGSGVDYQEIFQQAKKYAKVISYSENKGKGYALKKGLKYIKDNYSDHYIVVTMDCDGQHTVSDAKKLCNEVVKETNTLVIGKRIRNEKTPIRSKIGNTITKFIYRITTGLDVYDTQTGLRAFRDELINFLMEIEGDRFEYEMNVLLLCSIHNIKIKEIEISTIYIDKNSHSHFDTIKDSILIYKKIIKFSLSSIISFALDYIFYTLFVILFQNVILSNIIARIISATVNYNINRKMVFKDKKKISKSIVEYFSLALIILVINTVLLKLFVDYINVFLAKVAVEIILFIFSYTIQNKFIFKK